MNLLALTHSRLISCGILAVTIALGGCGGGGGSSKSSTPASMAPASSVAADVSSTPTSIAASSTPASVAPSSTPTSVAPSSTSSSVAVSSSSLSSSSVAVTTTYRVSVNIPRSFTHHNGSNRQTNIQLNRANFAVVSVDLVGAVLTRHSISTSDITETSDGSWTIKVSNEPRVDTVIIADVTKAIDLATITNIKTEGLVYAPTTSEEVDLDIGSTSAYENLLAELGGTGTFASQNIDPTASNNIVAVESLVNSLQTIVTEEDFSETATVSQALAVVKQTVDLAVEQEVVNIKNHVAGTAVSLIRDEGGLFWYNTEEEDIMRGALIGMATLTIERYEANKFVAKTLGGREELIVLSPDGWVPSMDSLKVAAYNDDGSVTTQDTAYDDVGGTFSVRQAFDLSGRNIVEFFQSTTNASGMTSIVNPTAVFASGAKGYRGTTVEQRPIYNVFFEPGDANGKCWGGDALASDSGGNCVNISMISGENRTWEASVSGYSKLFSPDVAINTQDYRAIVAGSIGPNLLEIQIVNDANKTVKFYENSWGVFNRLIDTSTWSEVTLPFLITDNKAVKFTFPQSVFIAADVWNGEGNSEFYVTQQDGYLRPIFTVDDESNDESVFFNAIANTSITNAAAGYTNPLVGNWKLGEDTFIFSDNNTFTHVKAFSDDPNCLVGSATGTYSWNPLTSMVNIELQADSTASEAAGSCSVEGKFKLTLSGNQIAFTDEEEGDVYTFTKVTSSTGLVGTWVLNDDDEYAVLLFTDTQYFLSDYKEGEGYGTESGTYTYNAGTSQFTPTVIKDNNDDKGFSDSNNQPGSLVIAGDNNSFTIGEGFVLKRLK